MIGANVARRYAKALLELGVDAGTLHLRSSPTSPWSRRRTRRAPKARNVLDNPLVAHAMKRAILVDIADRTGVHTVVKNALLLLGDRRRLHALPAIAQLLREMGDLREGVLPPRSRRRPA